MHPTSESLNILRIYEEILGRNRQQHNNTRREVSVTLNNAQIIKTEIKQGNIRLEPYFRSSGLNRYIKNILFNSNQNTHSSQVRMEHSP